MKAVSRRQAQIPQNFQSPIQCLGVHQPACHKLQLIGDLHADYNGEQTTEFKQ